MDYPKEYIDTQERLAAIHAEYMEAIKLDHPQNILEDLNLRISGEIYFIRKWASKYSRIYGQETVKVQAAKSAAYKQLPETNPEIPKSSRTEHVRYMFKEDEAKLSELDALIKAMNAWYQYWEGLRIAIQSQIKSTNTERILER